LTALAEAAVEKAGRTLGQAQKELATAQEAVSAVRGEVQRLHDLPEMTEADLLEEANAKRQVRRLEEEAAKVASRVADAQAALKAADRGLLEARRIATRKAREDGDRELFARALEAESLLSGALAAHKALLKAETDAQIALTGPDHNAGRGFDPFGARFYRDEPHSITSTIFERFDKGLILVRSVKRDEARRAQESASREPAPVN
jgi:acetoin utilization deacetylase AcuC-like enzyme